MIKLTPEEVRKMDRPVLESHILRLQALASAQRGRLVTARNRLKLVDRYVASLRRHLTAAIGDDNGAG